MNEKQTAIHDIDEKGGNATPIVNSNSTKQAKTSSHLLRKINNNCDSAVRPNISTGCDSALVACV